MLRARSAYSTASTLATPTASALLEHARPLDSIICAFLWAFCPYVFTPFAVESS